jgi:DNA-3-methyladenine glycosylase I
MAERRRCEWAGDDPLMVRYHDEEWGTPVHDDRRHFELLTLEGAQAGLSWQTVLRKREGYRQAFAGFDIAAVAIMDGRLDALLGDAAIIRNRAKIESTFANARAILAAQREFGSFDAYVWRWVEGAPLVSRFERLSELPAQTALSLALSKDLSRRGFRFLGPTTCYAYLQAAGMVNDHVLGCFRRDELIEIGKR